MRRKPYWMLESEKRKFVRSLEDTRKGRPSVVGAPAHHTGWAVHPSIHSGARAMANHLLLVTRLWRQPTTTVCPFFTAAADFLPNTMSHTPLDAWMLADDVWIALYMYHQEYHFVVEKQPPKKQALQWISSVLDGVVSIRILSRKLFRHVNTGITWCAKAHPFQQEMFKVRHSLSDRDVNGISLKEMPKSGADVSAVCLGEIDRPC